MVRIYMIAVVVLTTTACCQGQLELVDHGTPSMSDAGSCVFSRPSRNADVLMTHPPKLTARLASQRVAIGSVLWATVEIENPRDGDPLMLSWPYVGDYVSTVGVWRERWDPFGEESWSQPREIISLNKSYVSQNGGSTRHHYVGVPFVLQPGQMMQMQVPLNVAETNINLPNSCCWIAGVGFTEPGRYRVYVQYANLNEAFGDDKGLKRAVKKGDVQNLPFKAMVSAPMEVEFYLPKTRDPEKLVNTIRDWEKMLLVRSDCIRIATAGAVDDVLADLDPSETGVRDSLLLTAMRLRMGQLDEPVDERRKQHLETLLKECQVKCEAITQAGDPLAEPYGITRCMILRMLDRPAEALHVARGLNSPDARAFERECAAATQPVTSNAASPDR